MLSCPRCQRANPSEAVFCHFDGAELRPAAGHEQDIRHTRLPHEFVFPSGRRCASYDELVQGCQAEWSVACDLLRQGVFRQFLTGAGRMDLAKTAAQALEDPDLALDAFLSHLPARVVDKPRLDLNPRRLNLGTLHVGETRQLRLSVQNQGKGLLHGTLAVEPGNDWLKVGEGKANGQCLIKTFDEQPITLRIDTRGLTAPQKYLTKLTVITNGGIVEVPVRLDLVVQAFSRPPFQGASSPREMAEKMRLQPKPAVPLLESGEIARWFAVNGWTYPVFGPNAKGVAAVQQFFEGMGLSKPPVVQLDAKEISLSCTPGLPARGELILRSDARKWVYARAESSARWLRLLEPSVSGPQQAVIPLEVDTSHLEPGSVQETTIKIAANGDQQLEARVRAEVGRSVRPKTRAAGERGAGKRSAGRSPLVIGAVAALVLRLLLAVPADLYAGWAVTDARAPWANAAFASRFVLATWWIGALVGGVFLWRRGNRTGDLVCGLVAGALAGLAGSATLAGLLPIVDQFPGVIWARLPALLHASGEGVTAWIGRFLWIALACSSWSVLGGLAGLVLSQAGSAGAAILRAMSGSLSTLFRWCGLGKAAKYFGA